MSKGHRVCGECQFWVKDPVETFLTDDCMGECKRNPPSCFDRTYEGKWPSTHPREWCYRWEYSKAIQILRNMPYKDYLQSEHWKDVSGMAKEYAKYRCAMCGDGTIKAHLDNDPARRSASVVLNAHHNNYAYLGAERTSDLIVVCSDCHSKHHQKGEYAPQEPAPPLPAPEPVPAMVSMDARNRQERRILEEELQNVLRNVEFAEIRNDTEGRELLVAQQIDIEEQLGRLPAPVPRGPCLTEADVQVLMNWRRHIDIECLTEADVQVLMNWRRHTSPHAQEAT
jgi:hypothetical protein